MTTEREQSTTAEQAEVSLDIAASPDEVWTALTTPEGLAPWMGEGASIELRPGGMAILPDPVGGATRRGRVDRFDPGHRLDLTWWPALRPAEQTTVTITVTPIETGSRVQVIEAPMAATAIAASTTSSTAAVNQVRSGPGAIRSTVGLWAWRLALLSVCGCPSLV